MHNIVPQPPAHADAKSTSQVSERGDNLQSSEETTVNTTSVSERGLQSSEETTVNTTSISERGDNHRSSEETAVNNTSVDHTPLGTYTGHARGRTHAVPELAPGSHIGDTMDPVQHSDPVLDTCLEENTVS